MAAGDDAAPSLVTSRDGTEIGYWTSGDGPPLVLVHGLLGDNTRWAALRPHLEAHFTVHAMDRRGRGASGDGSEYDAAREFEDVAAVVDAVASDFGAAVDVVGSSGGACYALAAAALTSNIRRLVLFEPPVSAGEELISDEVLSQLEALLEGGDREGVLRTAYREVVGLSDPEIDHLAEQPAWPNRLAAAHTVPRELRVPPERMFDPGQASRVDVPTLVMVGGETGETYRKDARTVETTVPNARLAVLEGQGHAAEMFAPGLVAEPVLEFLREGD